MGEAQQPEPGGPEASQHGERGRNRKEEEGTLQEMKTEKKHFREKVCGSGKIVENQLACQSLSAES